MSKGKHNQYTRHDIPLPDGSTFRVLVYADKPWIKVGVWDKRLNVWDIRSGKAPNNHVGSHVVIGYANTSSWAEELDDSEEPDA